MKTHLLIMGALALVLGVGSRLVLPGSMTRGTAPEGPPSARRGGVAANGVIEGARPEIALRPEITGTITAVHVHENQDVYRGMLLVELRDGDQKYQEQLAQADVALARADLDKVRNGERREKRQAAAATLSAREALYQQLKSDYERSRTLFERRAVSQEKLDGDYYAMARAQADWKQAQAERDLVDARARPEDVAAAEARLAAAEARLELARVELAKTRLLAPVDGRVLQVYAEPGETAGQATARPVLLMANLSKRRVRAFVEELDVCRVRVGQSAAVTADGLPGKEFAGKVAELLPRMGKRVPQSDASGEYKDLYYREALIDLDAADELPTNLRVQVRIAADAEEDLR